MGVLVKYVSKVRGQLCDSRKSYIASVTIHPEGRQFHATDKICKRVQEIVYWCGHWRPLVVISGHNSDVHSSEPRYAQHWLHDLANILPHSYIPSSKAKGLYKQHFQIDFGWWFRRWFERFYPFPIEWQAQINRLKGRLSSGLTPRPSIGCQKNPIELPPRVAIQ